MRIVVIAALLSAGCATAPPVEAEAGGKCDAAKARALIGRAKGERTGAAALRLSGAATLRWIAPGTMVTMDFRENRLNLHTDSAGKVTKVDCG
ncbi:MAG TPA: I78 family peptidase inhibitor [Allosphingosinicella sp.]|nr:I78 family peptidase inhibitor [Allosphingosinicella sp.]